MKQSILFVLLLVLFVNVSAQDKKIAMLEPILISEGIDPIVGFMVRGELTKSLTREEGFSAFTRNDVDAIVNEYKFQESGMVDEAQRRKLGQLEGVDYVCLSKISKAGDAYYIEASLIHIETGQIDNPGTAFAKGEIENVNLACQQVAADMVGRKIAIQEKSTTRETVEESATSTAEPEKEIDTNPNNFVVLEVEVNFKSHKFMVCDKSFTDEMVLGEAARASDNLNYKGYSDWRLPTKHEAEVMQKNLAKFKNLDEYKVYWTSTQHAKYEQSYYIWLPRNHYNFTTVDKDKRYYVRCVRDFN